MSIRERIARVIAPGMRTDSELRELVAEEVQKARMALPISANYDPNNEGYRRMSGAGGQRRDLAGMAQDRMFEVAYYMFDNSAMTKRLGKMDKTFIFAEPFTIETEDDDVKEILSRFREDPENNLDLDFPDQMMWLGYLGEQCWPVDVNPHNGHVTLGYVDPAGIKNVSVNRRNVKQVLQVELMGTGGRSGRKMAVIRKDNDPRSRSYGRLVGNCFFFAINHPPNSPRGRSDFLTLFDWIDSLERYGYNYLERSEGLLNYVWDVVLKGMNEDQIREWLRDNPAPEPGSMRAHNESVEWKAVAPDIKAHDHSKGFDMGKSFVMGAFGRPDSWFGAGGKAYQTEAEQFGQVPIKDLEERQLYIKNVLTRLFQFQVDQAVIAGRLSEEKAGSGFVVNMPKISKKDMTKLVNGVPQLATALTIAEDKGWIAHDTATRVFAMVAGQLGMKIDADEEMRKAKKKPAQGFEDYLKD